jgi:AcrR family transcriptional regulator
MMDTKERILCRTGELFMMFGEKSLTMDSIAADLEISKRTIYELFRDKDDLLLQSVEYWIVKNNQKLLEIVEKSAHVIEAIFVMIDHQHRLMSTYHPVILGDLKKYFVRLSASYYSKRDKCREFSVIYALLEKGKREGIIREELKIDIIDTFIYEMLNMVHNSEGIKLIRLTSQDAIGHIFLPYFRGICTRKGQELIEVYSEKIQFHK